MIPRGHFGDLCRGHRLNSRFAVIDIDQRPFFVVVALVSRATLVFPFYYLSLVASPQEAT